MKVATLRGQCLAPARKEAGAAHGRQYSRLFPHLPPLEIPAEQLHALGRPGSVCDGAEGGLPRSNVAAGWPFFGQFVAHDLTADRSPLTHSAGADVENFRTPSPNLECLYGAGPVGNPYLYDREDAARFLIGEPGCDVPRNRQGVAVIGDPRNDSHLFVNQLHVALLRTHNAIVDRLRADRVAEADLFERARQSLIWHYQWTLLHDFLPGLVGTELMARLLAGGATLGTLADEPSIPYEFADAAYRYGHSQICQHYRVNAGSGELAMFPDLIGFRPVGVDRAIEWPLLFDVPGHAPAQRAERIDERMPHALIELPYEITGNVDDPSYRSLACRDLQRGLATALPSGEAIAGELGVESLSAEEIGLANWTEETPLWYYIVREADVRGGGNQLGPVGGRIVAEVILAIIDGDSASFRSLEPEWKPTLPANGGRPEEFGLVDLLLFGEQLHTN